MASASLSRRALIAAASALPALLALPAVAAPPFAGASHRFIEEMAGLHPNGRLVATRAMSLGLDPDDCVLIQLADPLRKQPMPILHFEEESGFRHAVVTPDRVWRFEREAI